MRFTDNKDWIAELKEAFVKLGVKADNDCCLLIGQAVDNKLVRQNGRIEKLEEQVNTTRVALAEAEGYIDNVKTGLEGEIRLVYEMLKRMGEKIERIETNTSKEQNVRTTWRVALVAALPGLITVIITIVRLFTGN